MPSDSVSCVFFAGGAGKREHTQKQREKEEWICTAFLIWQTGF